MNSCALNNHFISSQNCCWSASNLYHRKKKKEKKYLWTAVPLTMIPFTKYLIFHRPMKGWKWTSQKVLETVHQQERKNTPHPSSPHSVHTCWLQQPKLQTSAYRILPPTTAVLGYAIGLWKLSANSTLFHRGSNGTKFVITQTTQITPALIATHNIKPNSFESRWN